MDAQRWPLLFWTSRSSRSRATFPAQVLELTVLVGQVVNSHARRSSAAGIGAPMAELSRDRVQAGPRSGLPIQPRQSHPV